MDRCERNEGRGARRYRGPGWRFCLTAWVQASTCANGADGPQLNDRGGRRGKHQRPEDGRDCGGPLEILSLGHQYQSDVAEFTFGGTSHRVADESVWLSALYALIEGASEALEISRDDIGGAFAWSTELQRSIVLFDTVPGGAGAAKRIAENIGPVLEDGGPAGHEL